MAAQERQLLVDGRSEAEALDQQLESRQTATVQALRLGTDLSVDIRGAEHGAGLLGPIPRLKPALDATLAVAEATTYRGVHLKYLADQGRRTVCYPSKPLKTWGVSSFFARRH